MYIAMWSMNCVYLMMHQQWCVNKISDSTSRWSLLIFFWFNTTSVVLWKTAVTLEHQQWSYKLQPYTKPSTSSCPENCKNLVEHDKRNFWGVPGLPTSEILFPYFVEKISVFWVTFPYPLICSSPDSKHSLGNFPFTLVGPIHSQWKL